MSVILGINTDHACSAAALVIDGRVVAAIAEERLNRVKYYARFPAQAIRALLADAGLEARDIEHVALPQRPSANLLPKFAYLLRHPRHAPDMLRLAGARATKRRGALRAQLAAALSLPEKLMTFRTHQIEHHLAHIASAYFCSPWQAAAGFSADGAGDFVSCMLSECRGKEIRVLKRIYLPHSLGFLYTMICQFIGYQQFGDEGKVMGLAPYGQDRFRQVFEEMLQANDLHYRLNGRFLRPPSAAGNLWINENGGMEIARLWSDELIQRFGPPREPGSEISQRDQDLAAGVQQAFEGAYLRMLRGLGRLVPQERVAIAGGAAMNSVANGKIFQQTPFRQTWIQPAAADEGLALGAALYVSQAVLNDGPRHELEHSYLGPQYDDAAIRGELETAGIAYQRAEMPAIIAETAAHLEQGKIVGWFQGRMEWGPRALGNRSILAHPGLPTMKDTLNERIKRREWFRPFAPVVLADRQAEIFEESHPSPFMLHVYRIRPEWRERLCAVNHVDDTGRLQTVTRAQNPPYYDLIQAFAARTGIPVLVNTSFNENEPIVCTPQEAIACFQRTRMDVLVIGNFICRKEYGEQSAS